MKIHDPCVVSLTWTLKDSLGEVLDVLDDPVEFLLGGTDLLASIEQALIGREVGDRLNLNLEPHDAFGDYDERLVFLASREKLPTELEEGMAFEGLPPGCQDDAPRDRLYFVSEIYPEHAVLDGNHPLAGIALRLSLKVHAVREAEVQEVGRGTLGVGFFRTQIGADGPGPSGPGHLH